MKTFKICIISFLLISQLLLGCKNTNTYKSYNNWDGTYDYGWMDTSLIFDLYPEVEKDGSCGKVTQNFRGNIWEAEILYEDDVFTCTIEYAVRTHTYYMYPKQENGNYYLDVYNEDGDHECTFMKVE